MYTSLISRFGVALLLGLSPGGSWERISARNPNSSFNPTYSSTSALQFASMQKPRRVFEFEKYPKGFNETKVLRFSPCPDTIAPAFRRLRDSPLGKVKPDIYGPGVVLITSRSYAMDETEVSNKEWQHFLNCLANDSTSTVYHRFVPAVEAQPTPDYFTNPFYQHYPVVGLTYAQVLGFCHWRSAIVTQYFNASLKKGQPSRQFIYRLPTEEEWEYAAGSFTGSPYGVSCTTRQVEVNPEAAEYLQHRARTGVAVDQIRRDIGQFNSQRVSMPMFNYRRDLPYFLQAPTPDYIYGTLPNDFGLYQLIGNVAEMVQEPGVTKGGSYLNQLGACAIKARGTYTVPTAAIGFRCVSDITFASSK